MSFRRALISVSDKTGLAEFLLPFKAGLEILSTGGTAEFLRNSGFKVIDVSDFTGFPEVLDGRVKTLHPKIYMSLLARADHKEHQSVLKEHSLAPIDLVICNLYPFEKVLKARKPFDELIENIDIGGPTMLRASAKNYHSIAVLCDVQDYTWVQKTSLENPGGLSETHRLKLAQKVFAHVSAYDALIGEKLGQHIEVENNLLNIAGRKIQSLRYGENPQQVATWFEKIGSEFGLHQAQILQGKELSFNNILDLDASLRCVLQFNRPAAVAVKHNNPCGAGVSDQSLEALTKALRADPVSVFGGIVAVNFAIEESHALILQDLFLECIVAPAVDPKAQEIFAKKKNLRILVWSKMLDFQKQQNDGNLNKDFRSVLGGILQQTQDVFSMSQSHWKIFGDTPNPEQTEDLKIAEIICGFLKSNSIALVGGGQTLGLGMGQVNRVDAVEQALRRWKQHHKQVVSPCLASDAFFPFRDSIDLIAQSGVRFVLQPGGSLRDEEVIAAAKSTGVTLILTGQRHFRH